MRKLLFLQLSIVYAAILFLGLIFPYFKYFIRWEIFAVILIIAGIAVSQKQNIETKKTNLKIFVVIAFLIAFGLRTMPYMHNDIPLGYDAGLYKDVMEKYSLALPNVPEESLDLWIRTSHEQGLFIMSDALHVFGINTVQIETSFFILFSALLVFPIYLVGKKFIGEKSAVLASLLYAISYTQFRAFEYMYYKTVLGMYLLLIAIWLLETRHKYLAGLFIAGIAIFHRPELFLFGFVFLAHIIANFKNRQKVKDALLSISIAIILALPFYLPRLNEAVLQFLVPIVTQPGSGTFFDFGTYQYLSLAYLPFGFIGFSYLALRKKFNPLFFLFLANFILVFFELVFYYRFIIPLDVSLVIFASLGMLLLLDCKGYPKQMIKAVVALLFIVGLATTAIHAYQSRPQIGHDQIAAAERLKNIDNNSYIIAQSFDTPYVLGWSGKRVIAPGFLDWNNWTKEEWFEFMGGTDLNKSIQLLDRYNSTLYIYFSKLPQTAYRPEKFNNSCFANVYETNGAVIYKYSGC